MVGIENKIIALSFSVRKTIPLLRQRDLNSWCGAGSRSRRGRRGRVLDHQLGTLGGGARIGRLVVEAVVQLGIGNDDEAVVRERAAHQLLDLRCVERGLLLNATDPQGTDRSPTSHF